MRKNFSPLPQNTPLAQAQAEAQTLAATLPPLMAEAERVANTVEQGFHGRRRVGPGETFWQFRRYGVGDSASAVDWRQSARSQNLFVRENEWDAAQSVWIWCDRSASMDYRSSFASCRKLDRGLILSLALASLLTRGGERIAALGTTDRPTSGRSGLQRLSERWFGAHETDSHASGLPPLQVLPRYASLVIIGDFLEPADTLIKRLRALARTGTRGHLLQVLDPAEADLPFQGRTEFQGVEDNLKFLAGRAESLRTAYKERLKAHQDQLREMTSMIGWSFATHRTDHPATSALLALHAIISTPSRTGSGSVEREHQP